MTDFISESLVTITLSPFTKYGNLYDAKEFSVVSEGLSIIKTTENTVILCLNLKECSNVGKFDGYLQVRFKEQPSVLKEINFEYLLTCEAELSLVDYNSGPLFFSKDSQEQVFRTGKWT